MILIQRPHSPDIFRSKEIAKLKSLAANFFSKDDEYRSQKRFTVNISFFKTEEVLTSLIEMSHKKCFYCESFLEFNDANIDHFRPVNGALGNTREEFSPDHYWWLAYDWDNFCLTCSRCNLSKGNRFPVNGDRMPVLSKAHEVLTEDNLLLNPCGQLEPSFHLYFKDDGKVSGLTLKGDTTIDVLGLNRTDLVNARFSEGLILYDELKKFYSRVSVDVFMSSLSSYITKTEEFSQFKAQLVNLWLSNPIYFFSDSYKIGEKPRLPNFRIPSLSKIIVPRLQIPSNPLTKIKVPKFSRSRMKNSPDNTEESVKEKNDFIKAHFIEKVEIENFKSLENVGLDFPGNNLEKGSWLMLLGENGVGKSSILQAVAMALSGKQLIDELKLLPEKFQTYNREEFDLKVRVYLSGESEPVVLKIVDKVFQVKDLPKNLLIFGYGSIRIFDHNAKNEILEYEANVKNLFDPMSKLAGISDWLLSIDEQDFNNVARALKDILSLDESGSFSRENNIIIFKNGKHKSELNQLSDGYQSLIAMTGHLMMNLLRHWPSLDVAEGIVLIDEIGVHMHPSWKMRIVKSLRTAFPRVQFLCTTHDPLCLRGLDDREVEVVETRGKEKQVFIKKDLPSIKGMRIDQILVSEHFGMNSTIDPEMDELFKEYYDLVKQSKKSQTQSKRQLELKDIINKTTVLGFSRRERIAMEYIDEYISLEKSKLPIENYKLREKTKNKIMKLLEG